MGIFSIIFKGKPSSTKKDKEPSSPKKDKASSLEDHSVSTSTTSKTSKSSRRSKKSRGSTSDKNRPTPTPSPQDKTNQIMVENTKKLLALMANPNMTVEEFASLFVDGTEKRYIFEEGVAFSPIDFAGMIQFTRQSFPDFRLTYETIQVAGKNKVTIEGAHCQGTHTGTPFSPMPGYPPVEAKGIACKNDEERNWVEFDEHGKIKTVHCFSLGSVSGPVGFWEQIGGRLP